jgi:hypothetical protein
MGGSENVPASVKALATYHSHATLSLATSRMRFGGVTQMGDQSLSRLIELAKGVHMNEAQSNEQRNSFVYGNTKIENPKVTRELVEQISHVVPKRSETHKIG